MTWLARRALSAWMVVVAVAGALLLAPVRAEASAGSSGHARTASVGLQRTDPGELRGLLDQVVAAGAPGAAALVKDEQGIQQAASGRADLRSGRPMRPGLTYRAGSVTKPLVATVVLQLVAEGRLSLSDTVERWLPGILPYGAQVTIRQLLGHTGGVPDYVVEPLVQLYTSPQGRFRAWRPRELVALVADQPPLFPPGTAWSYSNTGYVLAGLIVEAATGNRLGKELDRRILRRLGLRGTFFPVNRPDIPGRSARGYSLPLGQEEGPLLDFTVYNPSLAWAAGNLTSDLGDLARFFRALLGGRLLPPRLLGEMTTPVDTGEGIGYGLGLVVIETPASRLIGHDGAIPGFLNVALSTEDGGRQVVVMMNEEFATPAVYEAFNQAVAAMVERLLGAAPQGEASTGSSLQAAVQARDSARTAKALARAGWPGTRGADQARPRGSSKRSATPPAAVVAGGLGDAG
jgi:D-alanyl-D-alanine carboxypeptidase